MADVRELLASAQAAEARGDKVEAIALLRRAAEIYRDSKNATRALKMLRHIRRLEGVDEDEGELFPAASVDSIEPPSEGHSARLPAEEPTLPARVLEERGPVLAPAELDAWCSFCCRPRREVGALVAAPTGTFICAACVATAGDLLKGGGT